MSTLRVAVIGVGYLGRFHAQKYAQIPSVELVAVCDANWETAQRVGAELKVPAVRDYHELIGKVDAVTVATTTSQHYAVTKTLLENMIHVLVEKPITETVEQANELIRLAKQHHLILQVGHLERFNAARLAVDPYLSNPRFIESTRLAPFNPRGTDVNVILDLMIHDIDLIQSMVLSPIVHIDAQGTPVLTSNIDIANVRLHFANGCVATITASRISFKKERKMRIFQPNLYVSIDFQESEFAVFRKGDGEMFPGIPNIQSDSEKFASNDAILLETQAFLESIRTGKPPLVSGEAGALALETAIRITQLISQQMEKFDAVVA